VRFVPVLLAVLLGTCLIPTSVEAQRLFVGLEQATLATKSSDLAGFPSVVWTSHFPFEVNAAACSPDRTLYLCNGPFTTRLYRSTLAGPPQLVTTVTIDVHGMGYGRDRLYGFSNYGSPMGIYAIDPQTGVASLAISTATEGFRFFGLDYNPLDDRLYGYTEYGANGLYAIDIDSGVMTRLIGSPPGVNGQGRALAVGNDTVYLLATRGDEGEPCFAYDLAQGPGGAWVAFTNPYPANHNTGGAAWIPPENTGLGGTPPSGSVLRLAALGPHPSAGSMRFACEIPAAGPARLDIHDVTGRRIATPMSGWIEGGLHRIAWSGRDERGTPVAAGVYLVRLAAGADQTAIRVVTLR
jgi:hypothetical protein